MDHKANMTDVAVAISGMGVFCPLGATLPELLENIREARCALKQIQGMDTKGLKIQHAAEIEGYDPRRYFSDAEAEELDPTAQFAILAARSALQHARLDLAGFVPDRVALVMGVCAGGQGGVDPKSFHDGRIQAKPDLGKFLSSAQ
jgi:3-oxoacyl-(acyl-carrier-protein) synthase